MSLLGTPLLILLAVLTVVLPALAFVLWSRVRRRGRAVRLLARASMIFVAQLSAIALVACSINDYALFYKSWTGLTAGVNQTVGAARTRVALPPPLPRLGSTPASAGRLQASPVASYATPSQWATRGRLETVSIQGAISRLRTTGYLWFPPQYFQARHRHTYFPAAEVFTGYPGVARSLVYRMHYPSVLMRAIEQHRARPMVLAMFEPAVTYPWDTECTDVPSGPQAETFYGADVPGQLTEHYRVLPVGWGAVGESTGGYCAAKIVMLNPGRFTAAVALSGYFFALKDHTTGDLWGGSQVVRDLNDLHWRLHHLPPPAVSVLVCTSPAEGGPDGYQEALGFVHDVRAPMSVSLLTVPDGGHNLASWEAEMPSALPWMSARMAAPGPAPSQASSPTSVARHDSMSTHLAHGPVYKRHSRLRSSGTTRFRDRVASREPIVRRTAVTSRAPSQPRGSAALHTPAVPVTTTPRREGTAP